MQSKPCRVLVVEDEGLIAQDIAARLEALGHQVVAVVGNGEEALEHARSADVVVMDIHIDGPRDGVQVATEIRDRFHIPVVFLTARSDRATLERAKTAGGFGYLVKPPSAAMLNASIEIAVHRHRIERQLEDREAWHRTILSSVADAVVVTDPHGRVLLLNRGAEMLTGWSHAEAEGQPVASVVRMLDAESDHAGGDAAGDPLALAILRDEPTPLDRSWRLVSRSGRELAVEGTAAPVKASGVALGAVLTLRDVSARRWEERQIRQSQKMEAVGRLAAGVSNDYTHMLAIIRSQADQLLRQFGEYSPARTAVEEIYQAAAAASRSTERLAAFGTRQVGQPDVISLNGVLRRSSKLIEAMAGEGVELAIRTDPACGRIRADAGQIEQAIMNLVMHACAVMGSKGRLLIETGITEMPAGRRTAPFAMLSLTHSGFETDPEKLFEPSSTGDEALALSLVHSIVSEHGGYVSAQASGSGGCRFEMLLPNWSEPAKQSNQSSGQAPAILLVDPRERIRAQLHNYFESNGFNLLEAGDVDEAMALGHVLDGSLDLVVADAAAAETIVTDLRRTHPQLEALRVVDSEAPAANEIRRPFTQAELLGRVGALLGGKQKSLAADGG